VLLLDAQLVREVYLNLTYLFELGILATVTGSYLTQNQTVQVII